MSVTNSVLRGGTTGSESDWLFGFYHSVFSPNNLSTVFCLLVQPIYFFFLPSSTDALVATSLPLTSAVRLATGFFKLHFPSLCLFPWLHVSNSLVVSRLCPCASCSNMHGLTHSLLLGDGFLLVDLASPSTPCRPIQGPFALYSSERQMLFRWMQSAYSYTVSGGWDKEPVGPKKNFPHFTPSVCQLLQPWLWSTYRV